jgi:hypothetical protein
VLALRARVEGEELAQQTCYDPESEPGPSRFTFLKCPSCGNVALVAQEDYGRGWDDPFRVYPPTDRLAWNTPEPIRAAYDEAAKCFGAGAFTACAIMCRKTLEGICDAKGAKKGNLMRRLEELKSSGLIDERLHEWADELRLGGNEAAHDVGTTVSAADARDIKDFTKAIVEYLFTIQERFDDFKARRAAKQAP